MADTTVSVRNSTLERLHRTRARFALKGYNYTLDQVINQGINLIEYMMQEDRLTDLTPESDGQSSISESQQ